MGTTDYDVHYKSSSQHPNEESCVVFVALWIYSSADYLILYKYTVS